MDKVQIVRYALMQIVTVIYGVWSCAVAVKLNKSYLDMGYTMPAAYYRAIFFRDYGFCFLIVVLIWTVAVSYLSSPSAKHDVGEGTLTWSGMILALLLFIAGTTLAIGGAMAPVHPTFIQPL
ncbi:MAG: hypothetical protein LV481_03395 [Methylacidiphilales bacterium]|nr:hypothetical protein [Candidatus Methylacidiphilales bacterium]